VTPQVASFGWEITNINNLNGADVYFEVSDAMTLNSVNIDVAFVPGSSGGTGFTQMLCYGIVSRAAVPTFTGSQEYENPQYSMNFGGVTLYNPNGLKGGPNAMLAQDQFFSAILKTYVPSGNSASATYRQVRANPSLNLNTGDYLVFHMDLDGVEGDGEMQVVLEYTLS
jgi:hypothetical protein